MKKKILLKRIISITFVLILIFSVLPAVSISAADEPASIIPKLPWENIVKGSLTQNDCAGKANVIVFGRITSAASQNYLTNIHNMITQVGIEDKLNLLFFDIDQPLADVIEYAKNLTLTQVNVFSGGYNAMRDALAEAGISSIYLPVVVYVDGDGRTVATTTSSQSMAQIRNKLSFLLYGESEPVSIIPWIPWKNIVKGNLTQNDCVGKANILVFGRIICGNCQNYLTNINKMITDDGLADKLNVMFFDIDQPLEDVIEYAKNLKLQHVNVFSGSNGLSSEVLAQSGISGGYVLPAVAYIASNGKLIDATVNYQTAAAIKEKLLYLLNYTDPVVDGEVRGKIKSYNRNKTAEVVLMQNGALKYEASLSAMPASGAQFEQTFTFENVIPGTYDLIVTKNGHLKYTVKNIIVGANGLDLTKNVNANIKLIALIGGDTDNNGGINIDDLNKVVQNFGKTAGFPAEADINGDGGVNIDDLNIVVSNFGKTNIVVNY